MKVSMKLSRKHPNNVMPFGRYMITYQEQVVELNDAEKIDLKNEGPKHWFSITVVDELKKPVEVKKKVNKKVTKKAA